MEKNEVLFGTIQLYQEQRDELIAGLISMSHEGSVAKEKKSSITIQLTNIDNSINKTLSNLTDK